MKKITAKQLKQHTGAILKLVRAGEIITLTYRGNPIAVIQPVEKDATEIETKSLEAAWNDIETALSAFAPEFTNWKEATNWVRNRT